MFSTTVIAEPVFPPDVRHWIKKNEGLGDEAIDSIQRKYDELQPNIQGAPRIGALEEGDAAAVYNIGTFDPETDKDWNGLKAKGARLEQHKDDAINPFLPNWISKADGKESPWVQDFGGISDSAKVAITSACRQASPLLKGTYTKLLTYAPTDDVDVMDDLVIAMSELNALFMPELGEGVDADWRYCEMLPLIAGLGLSHTRGFLGLVSKAHDDGDLDHWAHTLDDELAEDIIAARKRSGAPVGFLRCDWIEIMNALGDQIFMKNGTVFVPRALIMLMALHILKYTRIHFGLDATYVTVAYNSCYGRYKVDPQNVNSPLSDAYNKTMLANLCSILNIPLGGGRGAAAVPDWIRFAAGAVFKRLTLKHLCRARPLSERPEYIVAAGVSHIMMKDRKAIRHWINTGVAVRNVAKIDVDTGIVDKDVIIAGHEALVFNWPKQEIDAATLANWRSTIPDKVKAERASHVIRRLIKNVNSLGATEGREAVLDAIMTGDLGRNDLAGSVVGNMLQREFPLIYVLPMGHTMDTTTNQGKTNLGRVIGGAMAPGLDVLQLNPSTSAPAQRTMATPLEIYGTALYDEFQIPQDPGHFLNTNGLAALATGSGASPGKAMENAPPIKLKHPLILVSKVAIAAADILNRAYPIYLDVLSSETRCTDAELSDLMGGRAAMLVRLSHLMWMREYNIIQKIFRINELNSGGWRFNGHLTVAAMFASLAEVNDYMAKGMDQMRKQHIEAERSGLVDQLGMLHRFDPKWYFSVCSEMTLEQLKMASTGDKLGQLAVNIAMREILTDNSTRRFDTILSQFRLKEYGAMQAFVSSLAGGPWIKQGWKVTYVSKDESVKTGIGHGNAYITVEKVSAS